jgi:alanyl-tRNA synthetase
MRALYQVNPTVRVLKVVHKMDVNHVFLEAEELKWEDIVKASEIANMIILEDRPVYIEYFDTFEEVRKKYPSLRAYEERINPPIRVVVVKDYDYAACTMPHVDSTGKCILFLPTAFRKAKKNRYEIDFLVGEQAIERALHTQAAIHRILLLTGGSEENIVDIIRKLYEEEKILSRKIRRLTRKVFELSPVIRGKYEVKTIVADEIDMDEIGYMTSKWLEGGERIVIAVETSSDKNKILIACSEELKIDLRNIAKELFGKFGGRGGGKRNWVMGYVETVDGLVEYFIESFGAV